MPALSHLRPFILCVSIKIADQNAKLCGWGVEIHFFKFFFKNGLHALQVRVEKTYELELASQGTAVIKLLFMSVTPHGFFLYQS